MKRKSRLRKILQTNPPPMGVGVESLPNGHEPLLATHLENCPYEWHHQGSAVCSRGPYKVLRFEAWCPLLVRVNWRAVSFGNRSYKSEKAFNWIIQCVYSIMSMFFLSRREETLRLRRIHARTDYRAVIKFRAEYARSKRPLVKRPWK